MNFIEQCIKLVIIFAGLTLGIWAKYWMGGLLGNIVALAIVMLGLVIAVNEQ